MSNTDKSASARTKAVRNKTLAVFHKSNPKAKEAGGSNTFPGEFLIERVAGQSSSDCCSTDCSSDVIKSFIGVNTDGDLTFPTGGNNTPGNEYYFDVSWFSVPGATSYTITSTLKDLTIPTPPDLIVLTGPNSARITTYYTEGGNVDRIFTLTAQTSCGTSSKILQINSCFLAGSLVQMVNGTKAIEDVCVGDQVVGAFGEINTVLALHRPLLGNALMCKINDEHSTTNHHHQSKTDMDEVIRCHQPH